MASLMAKPARLPTGVVTTMQLVREATLLGYSTSPAIISELTRRKVVHPEPYRFSEGMGRPSRVWHLEKTLEALAEHYGKTT